MGTGIRDFRVMRNSIHVEQSDGIKLRSDMMKQQPIIAQKIFPGHYSDSNLSTAEYCFNHTESPFFDQNLETSVDFCNQQELVVGGNSSFELPSLSQGYSPSSLNANRFTLSSGAKLGFSSLDDSEVFSDDLVLGYISRILLEDDLEGEFDVYSENPVALDAEKHFYEILCGETPAPPLQNQQLGDATFEKFQYLQTDRGNGDYYRSINGVSDIGLSLVENNWNFVPNEYQQLSTDHVSVQESSQLTVDTVTNVANGLDALSVANFHFETHPSLCFHRGHEEALKFLPSSENLVTNFVDNGFYIPQEPKEQKTEVAGVILDNMEQVKSTCGSKGRKSQHVDLDLLEGRRNKQSAVFDEDSPCIELFDDVLLYSDNGSGPGVNKLRVQLQNEARKLCYNSHPKGLSAGYSWGKKKNNSDLVDLTTMLAACAQAVAAYDHASAIALLNQIKHSSSSSGDANQRLAHYLAEALEARLAGTGSQAYCSLVAKRIPITDLLKSYQLYLAACPFVNVCNFFSNKMIITVTEKAKKVHIIDFGIYYGFQWPSFFQLLSATCTVPPKVRITGINAPMSGFRPTKLIDQTGQRIAEYARKFNIQFEFHAIADKWENIRVEDLSINEDELLIVNCLYWLKHCADESLATDSPRNIVLNTIRKLNPVVFIHGNSNGSYNAPFFATRFREAMFYFSALFDMIETNVPRDNASRQLIERVLFGRELLNAIACEGSERLERPEPYKKSLARNLNAGFTQLPLDADLVKKIKDKVTELYHKDFVIAEDRHCLLLGWKGRIIQTVSTWKPSRTSHSSKAIYV